MKTTFTLFFALTTQICICQTIDFTPYPLNLNNPGPEPTYTATISQASGCGSITWTIVNGKIVDVNNNNNLVTTWTALPGVRTVQIKWDDVTAKGKLKATVTCSEGSLNVEKEFPICSLSGLSPQNPHMNINWKNLQPCDQSPPITLFVDVMMMTWTGGVNGSPMERADGYQWTIPAGWSANGHTGPATFNSIEFITVTPASACSGGTITVKGYKNCFTTSYSNPTSFDMNKTKPATVIQTSPGFTGSFCGNTASVTFTAAPFSCATSYTWSVSAPGWLHGNPSVFTTTQNTVTLAPSGDSSDGGTMSVTANLSCGTTITSQPFTLVFKNPVIDVAAGAICTTGKAVNLLNVAPTVAVTWNPGPKIQIVSGQGTPSAIMKQANPSIFGSEIINASANCPGTSINGKNVWVGKPYAFMVTGPTLVQAGSLNNYVMTSWNGQPSFATQGVNSFSWSFGWPPTSAGWNCYTCNGQSILITAGSQSTYVTGQVDNACGSTSTNYEVFVQQENCPPGGCEEPFIVYPNPSSEEFSVTLTSANTNTTAEITLIDSNGTIVYSASKASDQIKIPVKQLKNGVYYLSVTRDKVTNRRHVIINH